MYFGYYKTNKRKKRHVIQNYGHKSYISYCEKLFFDHGLKFVNPYTATQSDIIAAAKTYYERQNEAFDDWEQRARIRAEYQAWRKNTLKRLKAAWDKELIDALDPIACGCGYYKALNLNANGKKHSSIAAVMLACITLAKGNGRLFACQKTIAQRANLGLTCTKECLSLLEHCGALKRIHSGGLYTTNTQSIQKRSNVYHICYQQMRRIANIALKGVSRFEINEYFKHHIRGSVTYTFPHDFAGKYVCSLVMFRRLYGKRERTQHPFYEESTIRGKSKTSYRELIWQNYFSLNDDKELLINYQIEGREEGGYIELLNKWLDLGKQKVIHKVSATNT